MNRAWKNDKDWAIYTAGHWEQLRLSLPARQRGIVSAMRSEAFSKGASLAVGGPLLQEESGHDGIELVWIALSEYPRSKLIRPPMNISNISSAHFLNQLRANELFPYQVLEHYMIATDTGIIRSAQRIRDESKLRADPARTRARVNQLLSAPKQLVKMQGLKLAREKAYPALIAYAHYTLLTHGEIPRSTCELADQVSQYDYQMLAQALESYQPKTTVTMGPKAIIDLIEQGMQASVAV